MDKLRTGRPGVCQVPKLPNSDEESQFSGVLFGDPVWAPGRPRELLTDLSGGFPPFIFLLTDARSPGILEAPEVAGRKRRQYGLTKFIDTIEIGGFLRYFSGNI